MIDIYKMATNCINQIEPNLKDVYNKKEVEDLLFVMYWLAAQEIRGKVIDEVIKEIKEQNKKRYGYYTIN